MIRIDVQTHAFSAQLQTQHRMILHVQIALDIQTIVLEKKEYNFV